MQPVNLWGRMELGSRLNPGLGLLRHYTQDSSNILKFPREAGQTSSFHVGLLLWLSPPGGLSPSPTLYSKQGEGRQRVLGTSFCLWFSRTETVLHSLTDSQFSVPQLGGSSLANGSSYWLSLLPVKKTNKQTKYSLNGRGQGLDKPHWRGHGDNFSGNYVFVPSTS